MISIKLESPTRVWIFRLADSKSTEIAKIRPQSLWLLLRLWISTQSADGSGWVRAIELRERFVATQNLRMLISRAFADFKQLGVRVGWGKDRSVSCELSGHSGRSRGPFWLAAGESEKLIITFRGKSASAQEVAIWLRQKSVDSHENEAAIQRSSLDQRAVHASPAYWHAWANARADMLAGSLIVDGERGALAGYRCAHALTPNPWLKALALLQQAMVWRRAGNADAAQKALNELDQLWHDEQAPQHAWLGAMVAIVRAWCAYAQRQPNSARLILQHASQDPRWSGLFQYHPRVRTESANLQALIFRGIALDEGLTLVDRQAGAYAALKQYQLALALANETELFDSAASAASNLGWSLWLFERVQLKLDLAAHHSPLVWIALASWLGERHGFRGGCWNSIYLLRMVRDGGPSKRHSSVEEFRRWPVLSPKQVAAQCAPIKLSRAVASWLEMAHALQTELDAGQMQVDALQRANLLLEIAWYEAHQGDLARSADAALRLRKRLRELMPADRVFFREALRALPDELK